MNQKNVVASPKGGFIDALSGIEYTRWMRENHASVTKQGWYLFAFGVAVYVVLFIKFYPSISGIWDEIDYINQSIVFSHGEIFADKTEFDRFLYMRTFPRGVTSPRNFGRPLLNAPMISLFGVNSVYAVGAVIHLLIAFLGAFFFYRLGFSPAWGGLFLWHPTLAIYSRTSMGDSAAGLFVLAALFAFHFWGTGRAFAVGCLVGLAAVMRHHAGMVLPIFAAFSAFVAMSRKLFSFIGVMLAGGGVAAVIVSYNLYAYGEPLAPVKGIFGVEYLVSNLSFYLLATFCLWPGMILSLFVRTKFQSIVAVVVAAGLLFFSCYYFIDQSDRFYGTLVIGQRFLLFIIPLWIVQYVVAIHQIKIPKLLPRFVGIGAFLLAGVAIGILFYTHDKHLGKYVSAREEVWRKLPENSVVFVDGNAAKLVAVPFPGNPKFQLYPDQLPSAAQVAQTATEPVYLVRFRIRGDLGIEPSLLQLPWHRVPTKTPNLIISRLNHL